MDIQLANRDLLDDAQDFADSNDIPLYREAVEDTILCDNERDAWEANFDEWLDEAYTPLQVEGAVIYPSKALRECDPIAYRCALADWTDQYYVEVDLDDYPNEPITEDEEG